MNLIWLIREDGGGRVCDGLKGHGLYVLHDQESFRTRAVLRLPSYCQSSLMFKRGLVYFLRFQRGERRGLGVATESTVGIHSRREHVTERETSRSAKQTTLKLDLPFWSDGRCPALLPKIPAVLPKSGDTPRSHYYATLQQWVPVVGESFMRPVGRM